MTFRHLTDEQYRALPFAEQEAYDDALRDEAVQQEKWAQARRQREQRLAFQQRVAPLPPTGPNGG